MTQHMTQREAKRVIQLPFRGAPHLGQLRQLRRLIDALSRDAAELTQQNAKMASSDRFGAFLQGLGAIDALNRDAAYLTQAVTHDCRVGRNYEQSKGDVRVIACVTDRGTASDLNDAADLTHQITS